MAILAVAATRRLKHAIQYEDDPNPVSLSSSPSPPLSLFPSKSAPNLYPALPPTSAAAPQPKLLPLTSASASSPAVIVNSQEAAAEDIVLVPRARKRSSVVTPPSLPPPSVEHQHFQPLPPPKPPEKDNARAPRVIKPIIQSIEEPGEELKAAMVSVRPSQTTQPTPSTGGYSSTSKDTKTDNVTSTTRSMAPTEQSAIPSPPSGPSTSFAGRRKLTPSNSAPLLLSPDFVLDPLAATVGDRKPSVRFGENQIIDISPRPIWSTSSSVPRRFPMSISDSSGSSFSVVVHNNDRPAGESIDWNKLVDSAGANVQNSDGPQSSPSTKDANTSDQTTTLNNISASKEDTAADSPSVVVAEGSSSQIEVDLPSERKGVSNDIRLSLVEYGDTKSLMASPPPPPPAASVADQVIDSTVMGQPGSQEAIVTPNTAAARPSLPMLLPVKPAAMPAPTVFQRPSQQHSPRPQPSAIDARSHPMVADEPSGPACPPPAPSPVPLRAPTQAPILSDIKLPAELTDNLATSTTMSTDVHKLELTEDAHLNENIKSPTLPPIVEKDCKSSFVTQPALTVEEFLQRERERSEVKRNEIKRKIERAARRREKRERELLELEKVEKEQKQAYVLARREELKRQIAKLEQKRHEMDRKEKLIRQPKDWEMKTRAQYDREQGFVTSTAKPPPQSQSADMGRPPRKKQKDKREGPSALPASRPAYLQLFRSTGASRRVPNGQSDLLDSSQLDLSTIHPGGSSDDKIASSSGVNPVFRSELSKSVSSISSSSSLAERDESSSHMKTVQSDQSIPTDLEQDDSPTHTSNRRDFSDSQRSLSDSEASGRRSSSASSSSSSSSSVSRSSSSSLFSSSSSSSGHSCSDDTEEEEESESSSRVEDGASASFSV